MAKTTSGNWTSELANRFYELILEGSVSEIQAFMDRNSLYSFPRIRGLISMPDYINYDLCAFEAM